MTHKLFLVLLLGTISHALTVPLQAQIPAFPGAEGYGRLATGGRGGQVIKVSNLNDSGSGSLRAAVEASGPRIVVFETGGTITLNSTLEIDNGDITIAGQTAPGDGIVIRRYPLRVNADNVIIRGIRVWLGEDVRSDNDAAAIGPRVHNLIIDHSVILWGIDENIGLNGAYGEISDVTISWSIIAEGLQNSVHSEGAHSRGSLNRGASNISYIKNVFAHNHTRNPRFARDNVTGEIINNLVYNFGSEAMQSAGDNQTSWIGNHIIGGTNSGRGNGLEADSPSSNTQIYVENNIGPGRSSNSESEWAIVSCDGCGSDNGESAYRAMSPPVPLSGAIELPVESVQDTVLAYVGAFPRDVHTQRIIDDVRNNSGAIIDSPEDVGGYPTIAQGAPRQDSDDDGMPDEWENANGLNPNDASDANGDFDGDGYTNIEAYINSLLPPYSIPEPPVTDTVPPSIMITEPTTSPSFATEENVIALSGTADDNQRLASIRWTNAQTAESSQISATENWTISGIALQAGENDITVTAFDGSGNTAEDRIIVTATLSDTTPPERPENVTVVPVDSL